MKTPLRTKLLLKDNDSFSVIHVLKTAAIALVAGHAAVITPLTKTGILRTSTISTGMNELGNVLSVKFRKHRIERSAADRKRCKIIKLNISSAVMEVFENLR